MKFKQKLPFHFLSIINVQKYMGLIKNYAISSEVKRSREIPPSQFTVSTTVSTMQTEHQDTSTPLHRVYPQSRRAQYGNFRYSFNKQSTFARGRLIEISLALLLPLLITACDTPTHQLVNEGNEAYGLESYEQARQLYQSVQESAETPELNYNLANSFYKLESYAESERWLRKSLIEADTQLASSAFYNLANTQMNMQDIENAVETYKDALRLNPSDTDAKHNLELALQMTPQQQDPEGQEQGEPQEQNAQQEQNTQQQEGSQQEQASQDSQENQQSQNSDEQQTQQENGQEQNAQQENSEGEQSSQPQNSEQEANQQDERGTELMAGEQTEALTEEQARQLLEVIAQSSETLQERLQQIYVAPGNSNGKSW